ncbi:hypothetical protein [Bacillus cihuensis]|uniref:hypothetical protein n=1 Tax=Bacillus cihuensis TaxID=1208599 RepID=UPI0004238337|nr:hypothetical protein [Bacillus cihuensis]
MTFVSRSDYNENYRGKDDCKDRERKEDKNNQCFIATQFSNPNISVPAGAEKLVYENFTKNHNKATMNLQSSEPIGGGDAHTLIVTITTIRKKGCDKQIVRVIDPQDVVSFTVENLKRVVVTGGAAPGRLTANITLTMCICCNDNEDDKHDCCY